MNTVSIKNMKDIATAVETIATLTKPCYGKKENQEKLDKVIKDMRRILNQVNSVLE